MTKVNDRISIQVGLSGYSFKIEACGQTVSSEWLGAESVFTVPEFQDRYSKVDVAVFSPYCTLVPENFHRPELSREILADLMPVPDAAPVGFVGVPEYSAVLVYSLATGGSLHKVVSETVLQEDGTKVEPLPEMYYLLEAMHDIEEYNKIAASYMDGVLYLAIAQGKTLQLCNTYAAQDFTTAQYFIFMAMKKLQLNPEVSSICFRTSLSEEQEMSLYRYFKNVEHI